MFCSKLFQTNLWRFCAISRGYKVSKRPLMLSKFFASGRPFFAALPDLSLADNAFHRGAATQTQRILILQTIRFLGRNIRNSHEPSFASSGRPPGRSPWMKRVFRFSVHSGRFRRTNRLHHLSFLYSAKFTRQNQYDNRLFLVNSAPAFRRP